MTTLPRLVYRNGAAAPRRAQRGVVLFVALIVMVALSLAAVALVRSIDTTNAVIGNLGFGCRRSCPQSCRGERDGGTVPDADPLGVVHIPDSTVDLPAQRLFRVPAAGEGCTRSAGRTAEGVDRGRAGETLPGGRDGRRTPTKVSYVIERMCVAAGPVTPANCNRLPPKASPGIRQRSLR
jgi:hypothetical protein